MPLALHGNLRDRWRDAIGREQQIASTLIVTNRGATMWVACYCRKSSMGARGGTVGLRQYCTWSCRASGWLARSTQSHCT